MKREGGAAGMGAHRAIDDEFRAHGHGPHIKRPYCVMAAQDVAAHRVFYSGVRGKQRNDTVRIAGCERGSVTMNLSLIHISSVVIMSWPPGCKPATSMGDRLARAA